MQKGKGCKIIIIIGVVYRLAICKRNIKRLQEYFTFVPQSKMEIRRSNGWDVTLKLGVMLCTP